MKTYVTIHFQHPGQDWPGATSLRYRNRYKITVLVCS